MGGDGEEGWRGGGGGGRRGKREGGGEGGGEEGRHTAPGAVERSPRRGFFPLLRSSRTYRVTVHRTIRGLYRQGEDTLNNSQHEMFELKGAKTGKGRGKDAEKMQNQEKQGGVTSRSGGRYHW